MEHLRQKITAGLCVMLAAGIAPVQTAAEENEFSPSDKDTSEIWEDFAYDVQPLTKEGGPPSASVLTANEAEEISTDTQYTAHIRRKGSYELYRFTPSASSWYTFESLSGSEDTYVILYDQNENIIAEQDDSGVSADFRLVYYLEAGQTYYYQVWFYSCDDFGSFPVRLHTGGAGFAISGSQFFSTAAGGSAEMRVGVTGDASKAKLQWYQNGTAMSGKTSAVLNITGISSRASYVCRCDDGTGFTVDLSYYVSVNNGLSITRTGDYERTVPLNGSAALAVTAAASDQTNLKITWYEQVFSDTSGMYEDKLLSAGTSASYTLSNITRSGQYYAVAEDRFGNTAEADFLVTVNNNLYAWPDGANEKNVAPGEPVTLKVKVSADDTSKLTYRWYRDYRAAGSEKCEKTGTSSSYTVNNVREVQYYFCVISDQYGNLCFVYYALRPDNQLSISARGGEYIHVLYGEDALLETQVSAADPDSVSFDWFETWYDEDTGDYRYAYTATTETDSFTVSGIEEETDILCVASDPYGGYSETLFHVSIIEACEIALRKKILYLVPGESETLIADGLPHKNWSSDNTDVASVDQNGTVTAKDLGVSYIRVSDDMNQYGDACFMRGLFSDVKNPDAYYFEPVYWAFDRNITVGYGGQYLFSPSSSCTREQIVTFLWRLMGEPEPSKYTSFTDVKAGAWYYKPISWAAEKGITVGLNDGTGRFGVGQACTREMCVTFLYRAAGLPAVKEYSTFTDVSSSKYYYDSISWAAEHGITVGLNDGTGRFGVGQKCTRAMIVTFLYRYAQEY